MSPNRRQSRQHASKCLKGIEHFRSQQNSETIPNMSSDPKVLEKVTYGELEAFSTTAFFFFFRWLLKG